MRYRNKCRNNTGPVRLHLHCRNESLGAQLKDELRRGASSIPVEFVDDVTAAEIVISDCLVTLETQTRHNGQIFVYYGRTHRHSLPVHWRELGENVPLRILVNIISRTVESRKLEGPLALESGFPQLPTENLP